MSASAAEIMKRLKTKKPVEDTSKNVYVEPVVYARVGERIVCTNGHDIGRIKETMMLGASSEAIIWSYPDIGFNIIFHSGTEKCACEGIWAKTMVFDNELYVAVRFLDGWRYFDPEKKQIIKQRDIPSD